MTKRFGLFFVVVLMVGVVLGFSPAASAQDGWGTVKGKIVYDGQPPAPVKLNVDKDQQHCLSKGDIFSEDWVVGKDGGVRDVFIWLEPVEQGGQVPIHPDLQNNNQKSVTIDQPCCRFEPHALAIREGTTVVAKNSAPINHNFRWTGHPLTNPGGNRLMPTGNSFEIKNLQADYRLPVTIACDIHNWMKAYVRVFDHPYFAVTAEDGKFELVKAPAGKYRLKIWHPGSGWLGGAAGREGRIIEIPASDTLNLGDLAIKKN